MKIQILLVLLILFTFTGIASAQESNIYTATDRSAETDSLGVNPAEHHFENQISMIFAQRGVCQILWVSCYITDTESFNLQYLTYPTDDEYIRIKEDGIRNLITILESDSISNDKNTRKKLMALRKELAENY